MNAENYASREAMQRLNDSGNTIPRTPEIGDRVAVNCEGDWHEGFVIDGDAFTVEIRFDGCKEPSWVENHEVLILFSMAEVLGALPFQTYLKKMDDGTALVWICDDGNCESDFIDNANPTDALIDLLIWVRKEGTC